MPILFKTAYKASPISGMGLFAEQRIPKGATWWVFDNNTEGFPCLNAPNLPNLMLTEEQANDFVKDKKPEELE